MRAPHVTLLRLPVFTWTSIVTALMVLAGFPALLLALCINVAGRIDPGLVTGNGWNIAYQNLFWFYGHPVVYVMFFPFVGCVAEALATFTGRRFFGYKGTVLSLLVFAAGSMSVWGHHLFAGSVFGLFAGFYLWFPKATGIMLSERLGKLHWLLMTIGANVTFIPFFILGYNGMPRWMATYPAGAGWTTLSLISTIGAGVIGASICVFILNLYESVRAKVPAGPNPWQGQTLEWATSSPPPPFNFNLDYPVPRVHSYAPLLDARERAEARQKAAVAGQDGPQAEATGPDPEPERGGREA